MRATEHDLQVSLVRWFDYAYPQISGRLFAIPNGGQRHAITAAKLKREGVRRGVPDLFLPVANATATYSGLFIELKTPKGRPTKEQKEWVEFLNTQNFLAKFAYGLDDAMQIIKDYLDA